MQLVLLHNIAHGLVHMPGVCFYECLRVKGNKKPEMQLIPQFHSTKHYIILAKLAYLQREINLANYKNKLSKKVCL